MLTEFANSPYMIAAAVMLLLGFILFFRGIGALLRASIGNFMVQTLSGFLLIAFGIISGMISLGIQGYHALTKEEVAAHITVSPITQQRFAATFVFPDGKTSHYFISGDEIYIDANILKWTPLANLIGLHTAYELDRVGGRYRNIDQERTAERTIHSLELEKPVDLPGLRFSHTILSILMDAKYGSATYIPVSQPAELVLTVSTSGLILRESSISK